MTGRDVLLALSLCRRELRSGFGAFGIFLACLFSGVFAISAVGTLSTSLQSGLRADAKSLLGGDVSIGLTARDLNSAQRSYLDSFGALAKTLSTRTMARTVTPVGAGQSQPAVLVELKGVDAAYPLYGQVQAQGADVGVLQEKGMVFSALADETLFLRLGVHVGDEIAVGNARFRLRGVLTHEPDRVVEFFNLGPRLLISAEAFARTGLAAPGSLFRVEYLLRLKQDNAPAVVEKIRGEYPNAGWRVREYSQAAPRIQTILERLQRYLTLVGLGALLVGGLGIAGGVRGYMTGKLEHMATMKCMGGTGQVLFTAYLLQMLFLGLVGVLAAVLAGSLMPWIAARFFADLLPVVAKRDVFLAPLAQAALFGLGTTVAFSLAPLLRAVRVRPAIIFRGYVDREQDGAFFLLPTILAFAALAGLVFWFVNDSRLATWFVGGTLVAFALFKALAQGIRFLAGKAPHLPWASLRIGLANIHRPGSPGVSLVFALGFGLTALVAVVMVNASLTRSLTHELANKAPDFFFMDIRPDQMTDFRALVQDTPGVERLDLRPMIRGRIVRIGTVAVEKAQVSENVQWAVRGDRGLSWSRDIPPGSQVIRGTWWGQDYAGAPQISLTSDLAQGFGVDVGDTLTVNILGRNVTAVITSLREVNWSSLALQFAIVFSPGALDGVPATWLGTAYGQRPELLFSRVTQRFPDVAVVNVRDALGTALRLMTRTALIFQVMASVALVIGILVLAGAFAADQHRRIYDSVIYKVCGATRRDILTILAAEFSLAGLFTALGSLVLGALAAWGVVQGLFNLRFVPDAAMALLTIVAGLLISLGVGLFGTWRALAQKAAPFLRNE